jgi:hypothetical protein
LVVTTAPGALAQQAGRLTASPTVVAPGEAVTAIWIGTRARTSQVRVYLYEVGERYSSGNQWGEGAARGSLLYSLPERLKRGQYELRLYEADGRTHLTTSNRFMVDDTVPGFTASPDRRTAGDITSVTWNRLPEGSYWVALFVAGAPNVDVRAWQATTGRVFGTVPFLLPPDLPAGEYEFRLFSGDRLQLLATSNRIVVEPAVASLTVGTVELAPGDALPVRWSAIRTSGARVRLYLYEVGDRYPSGWKWGEGAPNGSLLYDLPKQLSPGTYELRLYDADGRIFLARSNRLTVDPAFRP